MSFFDFSEASAPPTRSASNATRPSSPPARQSSNTSGFGRRSENRLSPTSAKPTPGSAKPTPGGAKPTRPPSPRQADDKKKPGFDFGRFTPYIQQGWDFVGPQIMQRFGPAQPSPEPGPAAPIPAAPGDASGAAMSAPPPFPTYPSDTGAASPPPGPPPNPDRLAQLMQAMQQRQIPPLPSPAMPGGGGQTDSLGLLRLILANPQFQQALHYAALSGAGAVQPLALPMPVMEHPGRMRSMQVPLGAVINAIAGLTGPAMMQLNARTSESDPEVPEYLVSEEGEFIVDPASADERGRLVHTIFEASDLAQRVHHRPGQSRSRRSPTQAEEADEFARDVGL